MWRRMPDRSRWFRIAVDVPVAAGRDDLDVYHGVWALPPFTPCRTVVTIHDLTFLVNPDWFTRRGAAILRYSVGWAVKRAAHVIAVSERTKQDIVEWYGIPESRITVTLEAPRVSLMAQLDNFRRGYWTSTPAAPWPLTLGSAEDSAWGGGAGADRDGAAVPSESGSGQGGYFLHVGNISRRKNVGTLVATLAMLRERGLGIPLVIAGQAGDAYGEVRALVGRLRLDDLVRFVGYVSDEQVAELYRNCIAVVHPALYEGFGLTALEGMAFGRPVLVADAGALPEVVGDAGLILPPLEPEAWADAMEGVTNWARNQSLAHRGLQRASAFSWERCAWKTVSVYRRVVGG